MAGGGRGGDAAVVASVMERGIMSTISVTWVLVLLWPIAILVVEDCLKRRDYARHKQVNTGAGVVMIARVYGTC